MRIMLIKHTPFILLLTLISACNVWDEYYEHDSQEAGINLWLTITEDPSFSGFVSLVEEHELDTIFFSNNSYTVFLPSNAGLDSIDFSVTDPLTFIRSHIVNTIYLLRNVNGAEKLKTMSGKFMVLEEIEGSYYFNRSA